MSTLGTPEGTPPFAGYCDPEYVDSADGIRADMLPAWREQRPVLVARDEGIRHLKLSRAGMTHPDHGRIEWLVAADEQGRQIASDILPRP